MNNAIRLFRVGGIQIKMHVTFPLILIWAALSFGIFNQGGWEGALYGVLVTSLIFVIVVLHELGHSAAARRYDVEVQQIVLLPLGGVAQMERIPEEPGQELVIAIAGPLVNFVLAVFLALAAPLVGQSLSGANLTSLSASIGTLTLGSIFLYVFVTNLFIGVFNLIPAFPMDGGRILRALLATRLRYNQATSIAVSIGQILSWGFGLWGFLTGNFLLIILAVFIYTGAGQEGRLVQLRYVLGDLTVDQAYTRNVESIGMGQPLREAVHHTLQSFQSSFPICDQGRLVGILPYQKLLDALEKQTLDTPIQQVMNRDVQPVDPEDSLIDVQIRMSRERVDALPVVQDEQFLGMLTSQDLNEAYRLAAALDRASLPASHSAERPLSPRTTP
jgi:Zn-dependent protease